MAAKSSTPRNTVLMSEYLVLDAAQPLGLLDALHAELAEQLARALGLGITNPDDVLPLPADGEDGVHGRQHPDALLLEEVLQALEDEGRVGRVRLDNGDVVVAAVRAAGGLGLLLGGVAGHHVQPRQAAIQLVRRRHGAGNEGEVALDAGGQGLGRQLQRHGVRHLAKSDGRKRAQQLAVPGRCPGVEDGVDLVEGGLTAYRVGSDHGGALPGQYA